MDEAALRKFRAVLGAVGLLGAAGLVVLPRPWKKALVVAEIVVIGLLFLNDLG